MTNDRIALEAALIGYRHQQAELARRIAQTEAILKGEKLDQAPVYPGVVGYVPLAKSAPTPAKRKKPAPPSSRVLSAEGRAAIGKAAKKRWARIRLEKKRAEAAKTQAAAATAANRPVGGDEPQDGEDTDVA